MSVQTTLPLTNQTSKGGPAEKMIDDSIIDGIFSSLRKNDKKIGKRDEQIRLAKDIFNTIVRKRVSVMESPTGTGKSLAILAAACAAALTKRKSVDLTTMSETQSNAKTVIATTRKQLQEQLLEEYQKLAPLFEGKVKVALIKGKTGYIDLNLLKHHENIFRDDPEMMEKLKRIRNLAEKYGGDIEMMMGEAEDIDYDLSTLSIQYESLGDGEDDTGIKNTYYFDRAVERAKDADVVITNQAFFFAYNWTKSGKKVHDAIAEIRKKDSNGSGDDDIDNAIAFEVDKLPFAIDNIILDEAHDYENTVARILSKSLAFSSIARYVSMATKMILKNKGTLIKNNDIDDILEAENAVVKAIAKADEQAKSESRHIIALTDPGVLPANIARAVKTIYENLSIITDALRSLKGNIKGKKGLLWRLEDAEKILQAAIVVYYTAHKDNADVQDKYREIIQKLANDKVKGLANYSALYISLSEELKRPSLEVFSPWVKGAVNYINSIYNSVTVLSGTLANPGSTKGVDNKDKFTNIIKTLGIDKLRDSGKRYGKMEVYKGYDLKRMATLYLHPNLQPPQFDGSDTAEALKQYVDAVKDTIKEVIDTHKRVLILTPSHRESGLIGEYLKGSMVYIPGGEKLSTMVERLEKDGGVLVTASAWQGVDIDGLDAVVLTRIPFQSPMDPVIVARKSIAALRGYNDRYFFAESRQKAFRRLRQGMGRLIRNEKSKGDIYLLDSRIYNHGDILSYLKGTYSIVEQQ